MAQPTEVNSQVTDAVVQPSGKTKKATKTKKAKSAKKANKTTKKGKKK